MKFFIELTKEYKEKNPVENDNKELENQNFTDLPNSPSSKINLMNVCHVKEIQVNI